MPRDWISIFNTWAQPLSDSEAEKAERAERMVQNALDASEGLRAHSVRVFAHGSYKNDTNARLQSDVDINVCCTDVFIPIYSEVPGLTAESLGNVASAYTQLQFKEEVGRALAAYFGDRGVTRGNKVFVIHENSVRLDADVAPTFQLRLYYRDANGKIAYTGGTNLVTDRGYSIWNFPDQHYENGKAKNVATQLHFKRIVRILKRLRNEMADSGIAEAKPVASFLLESLTYNAPTSGFLNASYYDDVRAILTYLYNALGSIETTAALLEVNAIKYLFDGTQGWTPEQARNFVMAAWQYVGY